MNFHVGQKVVCVDGKPSIRGSAWETLPVKGSVYTIRDIHTEFGVRVEEIVNPVFPYIKGMMEAYFNFTRFRPVRTTDISIFTACSRPFRTRNWHHKTNSLPLRRGGYSHNSGPR